MKLGVIILDSLRYDIFKEEMDGLQHAADLEFESMYTVAGNTPLAHSALFTGQYPSEIGIYWGDEQRQRHLNTDAPTVAELLNQVGYKTVLLNNNTHLTPFFNFDRGFTDYYPGPIARGRNLDSGEFDWESLIEQLPDSGSTQYFRALQHIYKSNSPTIPTVATGARLVTEKVRRRFINNPRENRTIDWIFDGIRDTISEQDEDLFVFANLMTSHSPFQAPSKYLPSNPLYRIPDEPTQEDLKQVSATYRGVANYLDDAVQDLIKMVDWNVLFITSDHGELFGEHGNYGHSGSGIPLCEELMHVPGIAVGSNVPTGQIESPTSILDLSRTIIEIVGASQPESMRGLNVFSNKIPSDRTVYGEHPEGHSFNTPYYMLASDQQVFYNTEDEIIVIPKLGEPRSVEEFKDILSEVQNSRVDLAIEPIDHHDIPDGIARQLKHLGYK